MAKQKIKELIKAKARPGSVDCYEETEVVISIRADCIKV